MPQTNNVNTADDEPNIIPDGSHEGGEELELPAVTRATTTERRAHTHVHDSSDTVLEELKPPYSTVIYRIGILLP